MPIRRSNLSIELYRGDCRTVVERHLKGRSFDLVYIDPPYFTGKVFRTPDGEIAYDDRWHNIDAFRWSMSKIFRVMRGTMKPDASMFVQGDYRAIHDLKRELDIIFGRESFASEIIWRYRRWPTKGRNFQRVHDTLLRYVKDPKVKPRFNQLYEPLAPSTVATWGDKRQTADTDETGRRIRSKVGEEASLGTAMGDVWEFSIVAPSGNERNGYPTQKPEKLMERILESTTIPGDTVLDPMCGSGTMLEVARRMGRSVVGIDQSEVAIRYAEKRLGIKTKKI
jgi:DNA modification methylase